jgi:dimethylhistidine N-methyltransferase
MDSNETKRTQILDFKPEREHFRTEVLNGLQKAQKELPSKYFYDEHGSYLYERICSLDEYYPPRTEIAIMKTHIKEIAELLGPNTRLIEYGCGNCVKTRILLDHLSDISAYVPIDISVEQLRRVSQELASHYSGLEVLPVCTDYTGNFKLPTPKRSSDRTVVFFPGSTIGNFDPVPAKIFLEHIAGVCGPGGALLIGVDLKKNPEVLHRAYNDREGVTAAFNLNLLERINRELNGDFQLDNFRHYAFYNPRESRIEMHLVSLKEQVVHLGNLSITFTKGESIWTESSYKFNLDDFALMATGAGFQVERVWTDERQWFSIQYLVKTTEENL